MVHAKLDLIVIGSGPAGQKAAMQAAKLGKKVAIIEELKLGGSSLNSGTIPSKSLREAILDLSDFYQKSFYGQQEEKKSISINDLNFRVYKVIEQQKEVLKKQLEKNHIKLIFASASFVDEHHIEICGQEGNKEVLFADYIIIASGSTPRNPADVPFDNYRVLDSTTLLSIDYLPKSIIVLGAGVIGTEYASFFAALGCKVYLVDKKSRLLSHLDHEIGDHLEKALTELRLSFMSSMVVKKIKIIDEKVSVTFEEGEKIEAEALLYALGRSPNLSSLNLEKIGIKLSSSGHIIVNSQFQTTHPHIYAVGDVIGSVALAPIGMEEGRLAARHAFGATTHHFPTFYPIGIYTIPEISSCGYTEEELKELGFQYEIGRAYYYEIARNQIVGNDPGLFKILFHKETLEILGIHIIGRAATEVIHIGQVAMTFNAKIDYFIDQIFNYPTYAEGYRIAALNGLNKVKHKR